jgi:hypothetical protein
LQAENHFTPQFSGFISAGYNLLFSTEGGGTAGFIPTRQAREFILINRFLLALVWDMEF